VIRGYDADISKKNIECSMVFSGTLGIWSNIFVYFNPNKWFTRMGADVSGPAKLKSDDHFIWTLIKLTVKAEIRSYISKF
jgi:hypothetical protein